MRKQQIIAVIVVLLLLGAGAAGYQFYFKPTLEKFAEDTQYLDQLEKKLDSLKKAFPPGSKPEATVQDAKNRIQPWEEALERRVKFFSIRDFRKIDPIPETRVLKAYYAQASQKLVTDIQNEAYLKQVYLSPAMTSNLYFGMPRPAELSAKSVHPLEAVYWLTNIKFGTSVVRLLIDSQVRGIQDMYVWAPKANGQFTSYSIGVSMWMTMQDFCKFLEKTQSDESMFMTVQGFRIQNSELRAYPDPFLRIDVILKIESYDYQPKSAAGPAKPGAAAASGSAAAPGAAAPMDLPPGITDENLLAMQKMRAMNAERKEQEGQKPEKKKQSFLLSLWPF